jgi:hypothetical protein
MSNNHKFDKNGAKHLGSAASGDAWGKLRHVQYIQSDRHAASARKQQPHVAI